jgi:hypothetical protein
MNIKLIQLMYRAVDAQDGGALKAADYYCALNLPVAEMVSKMGETAALTEEMIEITATAEWLTQLRRPMTTKDILCVNGESWILQRKDNALLGISDSTIPLPKHKDFIIQRLEPNIFQGEPCPT